MNETEHLPGIGNFGRLLLALEAAPDFERLRSVQTRTNMFEVVGTTDRERWHSAFWAWMLDPKGSHGLGGFAVQRLFAHAADDAGHVPAVLLCPLDDKGDYPTWQRCLDSAAADGLRLSDLIKWRLVDSAVAPGTLSLEFTLQYLSKFLKDGSLTKEDLFAFYAGEEVKERFKALDVKGLVEKGR